MSKKYKHKPPFKKNEIVQLRNANAKLKYENETLQTALRMLTSEDKEDLLNAVNFIKNPIDINTWYTTPIVTTTPTQYFTTPVTSGTITITSAGSTTS